MGLPFRDRMTSTQIVQFKAAPNATDAYVLVEVTMARWRAGLIESATVSVALRLVADYLSTFK